MNEFVSKFNFEPSDLHERLVAVEWFSQCGKALQLSLTMDTQAVADWTTALESCGEESWENITLEAQNQLTEWLHFHDRNAYQNWNKFVENNKLTTLGPLVEQKVRPFQLANNLSIGLVNCVEWDILGALMENSYLPSRHRVFFFLELMLVYEAGHFPCGWKGEWPNGRLLVY